MKTKQSVSNRRERGAALLAALTFSLVTTMLVSAGLWVSTAHYSQTYSEARSESALLLAEGGINDEMALLAEGVGNPDPTDPVAATGETMIFPGEDHPVYGREGNVTGAANEAFWVCTSANEWWKSGEDPVAWDGVAEKFWVTSTAYVKGSWRRSEVQATKSSIFGQYAVYATTNTDDDTDNTIDVDDYADVKVTGTCGTNGKVRCGGGSKLSTGNCINSNKSRCTKPQIPSTCVRPGSTVSEKPAPYVYPTTCSVLKKSCGLKNYSDGSAWTWMKNNCDNATGIYTYKSGATSATVSSGNCSRTTYTGTTCKNRSSSSTTSKGCWDYARVKPGTSSRVKTLIFEPGDYYFTDLQLVYDSATEIVIDPMATASGGTPGQVRFWIYDPSLFTDDDNVDLPVTMTKVAGATDPDPSLFRVYYGKDGGTLSFNRPANCKNYQGYTLTGDFEVCGGVYAVTKPPNDSNWWVRGTKVKMCGTTGTSNGKCVMNGSAMSDRVAFQGPCEMNYSNASHAKDPGYGAKVCGGYRDGR